MKIHIAQRSDAPKVLAALYDNATPQGVGCIIQAATIFSTGSSKMSIQEAESLLTNTKYFDYLHGKCMKVKFSNNDQDVYLGLYLCDNKVNIKQLMDDINVSYTDCDEVEMTGNVPVNTELSLE